jgi:hypothetical protein
MRIITLTRAEAITESIERFTRVLQSASNEDIAEGLSALDRQVGQYATTYDVLSDDEMTYDKEPEINPER